MFPAGAFLNACKPAGVTSRTVVDHAIRLLRTVRPEGRIPPIGHTGTLDPLAEGVLPLAIGDCTRYTQFLPKKKRYRAVIRLGVGTDSDDIDGVLTATANASTLTVDDVGEVLKREFVGEVVQKPPIFSAIKLRGIRAHELARKGMLSLYDMPDRRVEVFGGRVLGWRGPGEEFVLDGGVGLEFGEVDWSNEALDLPEFIPGFGRLEADGELCFSESREVLVDVECSAGTYVRSIARDLGASLGVAGTISRLVRLESDGFRLSESVPIGGLEHFSDLLEVIEAPDTPWVRQGYRRVFVVGRAHRTAGGGPPRQASSPTASSSRTHYASSTPDPGVDALEGGDAWSHEPRMPSGHPKHVAMELERIGISPDKPLQAATSSFTSTSTSTSTTSTSTTSTSTSSLKGDKVCIYAAVGGWSPLQYRDGEARAVTREWMRSLAATSSKHQDGAMRVAMRAARQAAAAVLSKLLPPMDPPTTAKLAATPEPIHMQSTTSQSPTPTSPQIPSPLAWNEWNGFAKMGAIQTGFLGVGEVEEEVGDVEEAGSDELVGSVKSLLQEQALGPLSQPLPPSPPLPSTSPHPAVPNAQDLAKVVVVKPIFTHQPTLKSTSGGARNRWAALLRSALAKSARKQVLKAAQAAASAVLQAPKK